MLTTWDVKETDKLSQGSVARIERILYALTRRPARDTLALLPTSQLDTELYAFGFDRAALEVFSNQYHWDFRVILRELHDGTLIDVMAGDFAYLYENPSASGKAVILNLAAYLLGYLARLPNHLPEYKGLGTDLLNSLESDGFLPQQIIPAAAKGAFPEYESALDSVTGVPGRKHFDDALNRAVRSANDSQPLSLVILDLDHFKEVNDTFGHLVGDRVLHAIAQRMQSVVEGRGVCYRYGGEELAFILPNFAVEEAHSLAERAKRTVSTTKLPAGPGTLTASFGVATFPQTTTAAAELLGDADKALYEAKRSGRNRVCTWPANGETSPK